MATEPRNLKPQLCGITVTSVVTSCTFIHAQAMLFSFHPISSISFDAFVEWYFFCTHSTPNFVSKVVSITKKVIVRYQPEEIKIDTNEFRWFTRETAPFRITSAYYLPIYWLSNHVDIDYIGLLIDRKLVSVKKCKMTVVDSRLLFFPCCNERTIDLDFNLH